MKKYTATIEIKFTKHVNLEYIEQKLEQAIDQVSNVQGFDARLGNFKEQQPTVAERYAEHQSAVKDLQLILNDRETNLPAERKVINEENMVWLLDHIKHPFREPTNHSDVRMLLKEAIEDVRDTYIEGADQFVKRNGAN
tara:strand:+ start:106 stop:522 length:417 start_codon:yes stop_codon:yes gene_type:complete